jgi:hypothetical protein
MRGCKLGLSGFFVLLVFVFGSCRKPGPQSIIRMSDLHTEKQLIHGFYDLEAGAWRWTAKEFTVSLKTPEGAAQKGAVLTLQGTVTPDAVQNAPLEISSSVNGINLSSQAVSKAGELIYRAEVPAEALKDPVVMAEFSLSSTHQAAGDSRDLGVIASVIGLRSK